MYWLSHHPPSEWGRCYVVGRLRVCSRCLGFYPAAVGVLALLLSLKAPLEHPLDVPGTAALTLPAVGDWAFGRFRPLAFSNAWRSFTGILLGAAVGRTLYIHLQRPFPVVLLVQMVLVFVAVALVIFMTYRRSGPQ